MPKKLIRSEMLARRRCLPPESCRAWSFRIQKALVGQPEFVAAASLGLYSPIQNEVQTEDVFAFARERGKKVAYPRICGENLEFIEVFELQQLYPGAFGILEPCGSRTVSVTSLDLIILPGVAFDRSGYRLGYGKGYYDRVLHGPERPLLIGLAFERQLIDSLPAEVHDIRVDVVVTEERIHRFERQSSQVFQHCFHGGSGR